MLLPLEAAGTVQEMQQDSQTRGRASGELAEWAAPTRGMHVSEELTGTDLGPAVTKITPRRKQKMTSQECDCPKWPHNCGMAQNGQNPNIN